MIRIDAAEYAEILVEIIIKYPLLFIITNLIIVLLTIHMLN